MHLYTLRYYFLMFVSLPLFPVLIYTGKKIRRTIPRLPEAEDAIGKLPGREPEVHWLLIGESAFAGVGVTSHLDGIAGRLAHCHQSATESAVHWQVVARSGYRVREVLQRLVPKLPEKTPDAVVIGMGGNDTFKLTSPARFVQEMKLLVDELHLRYPNTPVFISSLPPVGLFPALAGITATILGGFVRLHADAVMTLHDPTANTYVMPSFLKAEDWDGLEINSIDELFSDGVHPSAKTYDFWAKKLWAFVQSHHPTI